MSKDRGGWPVAQRCVDAALSERGFVRPRDFQTRMNSHNWIHERPFQLQEVVPHIWVPKGREVAMTALAFACVDNSIVGLESALWVMRVLQTEPSPAQLVIPRHGRASRRTTPAMEFHWSDVADEDVREMRVTGIPLKVHSPVRALVDIIRLRPAEQWPSLREDLAWAASLELFSFPAMLALASKLRCRESVSAWISSQAPTSPSTTPVHAPTSTHPTGSAPGTPPASAAPAPPPPTPPARTAW
jgi:hypothetical protein